MRIIICEVYVVNERHINGVSFYFMSHYIVHGCVPSLGACFIHTIMYNEFISLLLTGTHTNVNYNITI